MFQMSEVFDILKIFQKLKCLKIDSIARTIQILNKHYRVGLTYFKPNA